MCDKIDHCQDGSDETPYYPAECSSWTHVSTTAYYVFRFGVGAIVGLVATVTISCVVVTAVFLMWYRRKVNEYRQLIQLTEPAYSLQAYPQSDDSPLSDTPPSMYPVPGSAMGPPTYSGETITDYGSTANIPLIEETSFNGCKV
ncbi:uncharacterized protein LOC135475915 [Liolophura sinensis]|uniref:uncharacterized protein LOC135475915 n=1 Tax=Liolophura sinensis TaxID=3198878 RepID=UPI003158AB61